MSDQLKEILEQVKQKNEEKNSVRRKIESGIYNFMQDFEKKFDNSQNIINETLDILKLDENFNQKVRNSSIIYRYSLCYNNYIYYAYSENLLSELHFTRIKNQISLTDEMIDIGFLSESEELFYIGNSGGTWVHGINNWESCEDFSIMLKDKGNEAVIDEIIPQITKQWENEIKRLFL